MKFNSIDITGDKVNVAILTNFMEFNPGYSLTGIVIDQAHMLLKNGHKVFILVNQQFNNKFNDDCGITQLLADYSDNFFILKQTKFMHLVDYQTDQLNDEHKKESKEAGEIFTEIFKKMDVIFTHDFIFTGWNLPYYHAIKNINDKKLVWYHWIHSVPTGHSEWWDLSKMGENHFIIFPNKTEIMRVAEAYLTTPDKVKIIPHIKDIRNWYDFGKDVRSILNQFPQILQSTIIQTYPCSTDRLSAKQLNIVIQIFATMKIKAKIKVFLIIANQWATGRQRKEDVQNYIEFAEQLGLIYKKDFIFTSEIDEKYSTGISKRMIREFQLISNLFIFPTREESFGLVGPEASFSGALVVSNKSLNMMQEILSFHAPAFDFGSFHNEVRAINDPKYIEAVSLAILNRIYSNEAILTKIYCRTRYNMDNIYFRYYLPLLQGILNDKIE